MKLLTPFLAMLVSLLRPIRKDVKAVVNMMIVIEIGIVFAGLTVIAYIIWTMYDQLITPTTSASVNSSLGNITQGFDNTVALILVAIAIFVMALMISALLLLKRRK